MKPSRLLRAAPEVTDLIGTEELEHLARSAADGYNCTACGLAGDLAGRPEVVVLLGPAGLPDSPQVAHVRLAHSGCLPSQVITSPEPGEPPGGQMMLTAAVVPHRSGPRALLIAQMSVTMAVLEPGGGRTDLWLSSLLGQGLHLLGAADEPAPPSAGWVVLLPSPGAAVIRDPHGLFYEGSLPQPLLWRQLTGRRGQVELLAGMAEVPASAGELPSLLAEAARDGELVGGSVVIRRARR